MSSIVIIGAGIVGCSTAFYLTETASVNASSIHLVEASPEFFASASGKAGGFLAADWFAPESLPLGKLSFKLHKELAERYDGKSNWGYSRSTGTSYVEPRYEPPKPRKGRHSWLEQGQSRAEAAGGHEFRQGDGPAWLARREGDRIEVIGSHETVAQVDPLRLSEFLLQECRRRGVHVHQPAKAMAVTLDEKEHMTGVKIAQGGGHEVEVPCNRLLLAAGAWTGRVFMQLFPSSTRKLPITHIAGHSLVLRSPRWSTEHEAKGCHAIFSTMRTGLSPEMFSRIGGEIYVAGLNSTTIPLPDLPTDAVIDDTSITELLNISQKLIGSGTDIDDLEVTREGLCFRPATPHGQPLLSRIPGKYFTVDTVASPAVQEGVFVAAGHGPWGIALSLGTGKVMAELLLDQKPSANIDRLALR